MKIEAIHSQVIELEERDLLAIVERCIAGLAERSIVAITSKVVALAEGRIVSKSAMTKGDLIRREADLFAPVDAYDVLVTITAGRLILNAGVDESNSGGYYILWPANPQRAANQIRSYLSERFRVDDLGVVVTDSVTPLLRGGIIGTAIAHSGFNALHDYIGEADVFGRPMRTTRANVADGVAASAVLVMGEGSERTPLAVATELPAFVQFQRRDPTAEELNTLRYSIERDLYAPLLLSVLWETGGGGSIG